MIVKPTRVNTIKQISTEQIESVFTYTLSKLLDNESKVAIGKVDFSSFDYSNGVAHIPMELVTSRVVGPIFS